jgi:hypothetical protein
MSIPLLRLQLVERHCFRLGEESAVERFQETHLVDYTRYVYQIKQSISLT